MWVYMGILCHAFKKNDEWIMAWIFFGMIIVCYIGLINLLCMGILNVCCLAPLYPMGSNGCSNSSRWGEFSQSVRNKIVDFNSHCIDGTQYIQSQFLYKKQIMKYNSRCILFLLIFLLYIDYNLRFLVFTQFLPIIEIQITTKKSRFKNLYTNLL